MDDKQSFVYDGIGPYKVLRQLNEECAELIQASSKIMRLLEGEKHINNAVAMDNLHEEAADVMNCLDVLLEVGFLCEFLVNTKKEAKLDRWVERVISKQKEDEQNGQRDRNADGSQRVEESSDQLCLW